MIVLTNFILEKENFKNLNNPFVATTIVSSPMLNCGIFYVIEKAY